MKNPLMIQILLLGTAILLVGCSGSEDYVTEGGPPDSQSLVWNASLYATRDSIDVNDDVNTEFSRALFYGGNSARYYTIWDQGDILSVYKNSAKVGTLSPLEQYWGTVNAYMTGVLTGPFAVDDVLDLYLPTKEMNFAGQKGTINDLSAHFAYAQASTTVTEAADQILSLSDVSPTMRQEFLRFVLTDEITGSRLHPERLDIEAVSGGQIVQSMAEDGTVVPCDVLTVLPEMDNGEYPSQLFVGLLSVDRASVTYRIKAYVGSDVYVGPIEGQNPITRSPNIGALTRILRQMRKTTAVSTLTVADIPSRVFTGSAYEPAVTVTDGEDALELNTDYSVSYADNTNVGEATVTVKGLADAGAVAATKYLGTKDKTFNIVKATPVITMPTEEDMTLEVGLTRQRAVSSVTLDNSAFGLPNLDIMAAPYNCTINYSSADESVATVSSDGTVTGVATGTTTITVTVDEAQNWTEQTKTYTVKVSPRVNTSGNANWTVTEDAESGNVYQ